MGAKYVFITGGVVSGLGKGITAASLGRQLKARGYRVTIQKFDPYINVDPGRMCPLQHGEVFVTDDGAETDLDLGHYERFVDENLSINSSVTTGKIYWNVLHKERRGEYGGSTVQVIPHITGAIMDRVYKVGKSGDTDIVITEIGGTVGDIESQPFLEAIRQVSAEVGPKNAMFIHVTLVPFISGSNELKTKPTQHSVKSLLSLGIQPNVIVARSSMEIDKNMRDKIALFCNMRGEDVIQNLTADSVYEVPLWLEREGLGKSVCYHLDLPDTEPDLSEWMAMVEREKNPKKTVTVGICGRYVALRDAYLSLAEAINHAGIHNQAKPEIKWIAIEDIVKNGAAAEAEGCDGIIAAGSFGEEDCEGYIALARHCRELKTPYLGICLGMQAAVLDISRNITEKGNANSIEYDANCLPVIDQLIDNDTGESPFFRKGLFPCKLEPGSRIAGIYGKELIYERHRCAYEVNPSFRSELEAVGLSFTASSPDEFLTEAVELSGHPWFMGVQFDPQYISRPGRAHPILADFVRHLSEK